MITEKENKRSGENAFELILKKKICGICNSPSNELNKSYNVYLSANRTVRCHAFCIESKGGLVETKSFLEKKLKGIFYFTLNNGEVSASASPSSSKEESK